MLSRATDPAAEARAAPGAHRPVPHAAPLVAVCIATYRRPVMLRRLLVSLGGLAFDDGEEPRVLVLVVDNDAGESARPAVGEVLDGLSWPVAYLVEPERNISLARNRAVAEALARGADFVAFVDDDEAVHPRWLAELLAVQRTHGADVVSGPAIPVYPGDAPEWLVRAGFFAARRPPTGTPVAFPNMYNALVSAAVLRSGPGPFDPAFGLTGGGDSLFFTRCHRRGLTMVAADSAMVEEWVVGTRTRPLWVLQRAFRVGNTAVRVERRLPPGQRRLGVRLVAGTVRLLGGALAVLPAAAFGRGPALRALWNVWYGAGCLSALAGYCYVEYRRVHGE